MSEPVVFPFDAASEEAKALLEAVHRALGQAGFVGSEDRTMAEYVTVMICNRRLPGQPPHYEFL